MDNMKDVILEAVEMNGIENVVMPLMNEIFLSFTDIAGTRYVDNQDVFKRLERMTLFYWKEKQIINMIVMRLRFSQQMVKSLGIFLKRIIVFFLD